MTLTARLTVERVVDVRRSPDPALDGRCGKWRLSSGMDARSSDGQ
ncbi:MAG: hypothetical protein ACREM3_11445 [Candidatus Rokuibacteriota bacterium]